LLCHRRGHEAFAASEMSFGWSKPHGADSHDARDHRGGNGAVRVESSACGSAGPQAVLAGIFLITAVISQFISNTSSALVMMPIGLATASELGVSPLPMMLGVAMGASASFLTPFANGVSLMVYGPGGYRFGDFWKLGLIVMAWALAVTVVVIPLQWKF